MPNNKKVAPKGAYAQNFDKCVRLTGKWRGKIPALYKKHVSRKKFREENQIINGKLVYPKVITYPKFAFWLKMNYQSKLT